jgi:hypothetical protein
MFAPHGKPLGVYRRGWFAWLISGCFAVMGLVLGAGLSDPHLGWKVFGGVMAALCIGYAYVMWRAATVVLYSNGALVGTPFRPRWIPWDECGTFRCNLTETSGAIAGMCQSFN